MKKLFVSLIFLMIVLVLSTGCFSNSSTYTTSSAQKAPVGVWFMEEPTDKITFYIYDNGQGQAVSEYNDGAYTARDFDLELLGYTGYVKKIEYGVTWEVIDSNKYLLTAKTVDIEMYNGQHDYYSEDEFTPISLGTLTVYSEDIIGWDIDNSEIYYRLNRIA